MDYAGFQAWLAEELWRTGDAAFMARMPEFVRQGEAKLLRDTKLLAEEATTTLSATSQDVALPANFAALRALSTERWGPMRQATVDEVLRLRRASGSGHFLRDFAISGSTLYLVGPMSATDPQVLTMIYTAQPPSLVDAGTHPVLDRHPDLYLAAVAIGAARNIREYGSQARWQAEYDAQRTALWEHETKQEWGSGPLKMRFTRSIA